MGELTQSEADCAIAGIVTGLRSLKTRKGDRMAVFMLEDESAKVESVVFPEAFTRFGGLVVDDAMLLVRGKYERGRGLEPSGGERDHAARDRSREGGAGVEI